VPATTATVTGPPRPCQGPPGQVPARRSCQGPAAQVPTRPPHAVLDLGAVPTAPPCAGAWTREILWEWGAAELADTAELLASELVTTSVKASVGLDRAAIRLVLTLDKGELAILVHDNHPGVPLAVRPGADDESGGGLLIVEHISDRCGWYPLHNSEHAKVTWAVITRVGQAPGWLPASALPVRRRPAPAPARSARAPRPVDPASMARVKSALERL
jgi:hypothetical protein